MDVGIVGCGNIGRKRAKALAESRLVACFDIDRIKAETLAKENIGVEVVSHWQNIVTRDDIEIVIVATTHDSLAKITIAAVRAGKHVLVEKPGARNIEEIDQMISAAEENNVLVRVGFNHRYHPSILKAKEIFSSGKMGALMFIRGRYGHGGRIGYEKEWRANKKIAGGGELIDQGMHLIDLSRIFLGEFEEVQGFAHTYYWDIDVEDNGFMLLKTKEKQAAFLHATWTEWKNTFSFEIYGRDAKIDISGLGGSYGVERITYYKMGPQMGPPKTIIWEFPFPDNSWETEFKEFEDDICFGRQPSARLEDARAALKIIKKIYQESNL